MGPHLGIRMTRTLICSAAVLLISGCAAGIAPVYAPAQLEDVNSKTQVLDQVTAFADEFSNRQQAREQELCALLSSDATPTC